MKIRTYAFALASRALLLAGALAWSVPGQAFLFSPVVSFVPTPPPPPPPPNGGGGSPPPSGPGCTVTPGSQTFTSSGTFTVPCFNSFTIQIWGGGGGGGTFGQATGNPGGATSAGPLYAGGGSGGGGSFNGSGVPVGGAGGSSSGGTTNAPGNSGSPGGQTTAGFGGNGGNAPNGGAGGIGTAGTAGSPPGGGGAGATIGGVVEDVCGENGCFDETIYYDGAGGGGSGAFAQISYTYGQITVGTQYACSVGAGAAAKTNGGYGGHSGGRGQCTFTWN